MDRKLIDQFEVSLNQIVGLKCWGVIAGSGTGSVIDIQLGDRIRRRKPLKNPTLTDEQQKFESAFALFIECVWRLDSESRVICGAWDDNSEGGVMITGLRQLVGCTVSSIDILRPSLDLSVSFLGCNGKLNLKVFCDSVNSIDADDNYSLATPSGHYVIGNRSALRIE